MAINKSNSFPYVSIIIPVYNSEATIAKCIESLLKIDYPTYDIIVVDDGSTDRTKVILSGYKEKIKIIEVKHCGPSKCRNIALQQTQAAFIAFTDSDCIVDRNWIKELVKGFVSEKIAGVGGSQLPPDDETSFGRNVQTFFEQTGFLGGYIKSAIQEKIKEVSHNPCCNVIYRKDVLLQTGGFDENLWPCEDVDLDYRLNKKGFKLMYNPKAIVYHYRPQNLKALSMMMFRYGYVQGILTKRYGFFRRIQLAWVVLVILFILIILNHFWLIVPVILYVYFLFRIKNVLRASYVFIIGALSACLWMIGYFKGLVIFRR